MPKRRVLDRRRTHKPGGDRRTSLNTAPVESLLSLEQAPMNKNEDRQDDKEEDQDRPGSSASDDDSLPEDQDEEESYNEAKNEKVNGNSESDSDAKPTATKRRGPKARNGTKKKIKSKRQTRSTPRGKTKAQVKSQEFDDDDDEDSFDSANDEISDASEKDDSHDEDFHQEDDDSEESEDEDVDADDYEREPAVGRRQTRRPRNSKATTRRQGRKTRQSKGRTRNDDSSEEEGHDSGESSSDDDDDDPVTPRGGLRNSPRRRSAQKADRRLQTYQEDDSDDDNEEDAPAFPARRRKSKKDSDDESFHGENDDNDDDEDDELEDESSNAESEQSAGVGIVRDGDIGTADDSSDDDDEPPKKFKSPQLKLRTTGKEITPLPKDYDSGMDSSEDESTRFESPPKLPACGSTKDAITADDLPAKHVCYYSPDGSTRHCFALETLRKVAMMAKEQGNEKYNNDGTMAFLQPPHFRSVISDDLIDQIASRFGREALQIDGPFYAEHKPLQWWERGGDEFDSEIHAFEEKVKKFAGSIMGSKDLYSCPLCYTVAYNRSKISYKNKRKSADITERYSTDFGIDPMSVLVTAGRSDYDVASTFCFRTVAALKKHLRDDHNVDNRVISGNSLYTRFMIRARDGLLQHFLRRGSSTVQHGDMLSYWFSGNNFEFIHLLDSVAQVEQCRQVLASRPGEEEDEDVEAAHNHLEPGRKFFRSFQKDAQDLWSLLAGPYMTDGRDLDDFVAGEEESEDEDGEEAGESAQAAFRDQQRQELEDEMEENRLLADRYNRMAEDELDEEESEESDEGELELVYKSDEESEEEDEWMAQKRRSFDERRRSHSSSSPEKKRRTSLENSDDEVEVVGVKPAAKPKRRRSVLEDDDDDDDIFQPAADTPKNGRRLSIQASDDEDDESDDDFIGVSASPSKVKRLSISADDDEEE